MIISPVSLQGRSDIRWGTGKKSAEQMGVYGNPFTGKAVEPVKPLPSRSRGYFGIPACWFLMKNGLAITGTAGLLTDAAAAGLVDFEDVFLRLSQAAFRLSSQVVETLRQSVNKHRPSAES